MPHRRQRRELQKTLLYMVMIITTSVYYIITNNTTTVVLLLLLRLFCLNMNTIIAMITVIVLTICYQGVGRRGVPVRIGL